MKKAIITGITGQDGSYLAELLLERGYEVHGIVRRSSVENTNRINHILNNMNLYLHYGDITDTSSIFNVISKTKPDEIYNLAAQSHVKISFDNPEYTASVTGLGTVRILEAIRQIDKNIRFYQASTSELYGLIHEPIQSETTPFYPRSPYGCAKLYSYWITKNYREAYGMFACNGILFNHESPRRGVDFVTRKITLAVANILKKKQNKLYLGNIDAYRDWGYAKDYVYGMWLMLQGNRPDDYVLATGEKHTVREFCDIAFRHVGLDYRDYVEIDPALYRPAEVDVLLGNPDKAMRELAWKPTVKFEQLVKLMVDSDIKNIR